MSTVEAVLFDLGGVVLTSPFEAFARYERDHRLPPGFLRLVNSTDEHTNAWARLERAELTLDEFSAAFEAETAAAGHRVRGGDVLGLLRGEVRPAMATAVRRCAARLPTGFITNNPQPLDLDEIDAELAELMGLVHAVVESSVEGVRKPEPAMYSLACERLGVEPHVTVMLDDLGVNLKPARELGMTTIKVTDPDLAIGALETVVGFSLR